jgi:hypothetical protein
MTCTGGLRLEGGRIQLDGVECRRDRFDVKGKTVVGGNLLPKDQVKLFHMD